MKPTFWLDVLTSNSLCLMATMSMLYFFIIVPLSSSNFNSYFKTSDTQEPLYEWDWKW